MCLRPGAHCVSLQCGDFRELNRLEGQLEFAMGNVLLHVGQSAATPRAARVLVDFFSSLHPVLKAWCIWHLNVCAMDTVVLALHGR